MVELTDNEIDRFYSHIIFPLDCINECWLTDLSTNTTGGYPRLKISRGKIKYIIGMHRISYYIHCGDIPDNLLVCHKCNNTECVNPYHLYIGSHQDNVNDRTLAGNNQIGELNIFAILTDDQVTQILIDVYNNKYNNLVEIAQEYNVGRSTIYDIFSGSKWKHITNKLQVPLHILSDKIMINSRKNEKRDKLNIEKAKQIKELLKNNHKPLDIAHLYNVDITTINDIKFGRTWKKA